jgi:hypothetical protein
MPTCTIFFFIVGEVLNAMVKQATKIVEVVGIKVPKKIQQQILSQYAMNIKFTLIILFIKVLAIRDFLRYFHMESLITPYNKIVQCERPLRLGGWLVSFMANVYKRES